MLKRFNSNKRLTISICIPYSIRLQRNKALQMIKNLTGQRVEQLRLKVVMPRIKISVYPTAKLIKAEE